MDEHPPAFEDGVHLHDAKDEALIEKIEDAIAARPASRTSEKDV
jgi:hypothetical protein